MARKTVQQWRDGPALSGHQRVSIAGRIGQRVERRIVAVYWASAL